jgi:exopolysaccharide biosynthesis polyprenyl glycosylphosphotransferase
LLEKVRLHDRNLRFVAIVGTNQRAYNIGTWINKHQQVGYRVRGYIDDVVYHPKEHLNILGKLSDFPNILRNIVIDEVFIALPIKSKYDTIKKIIDHAEEQGIKVRHISHCFNTNGLDKKISSFEEFPILAKGNGPQEGWQLLAKRTLDIIVASGLLILTLPLMIATAIAIKLSSPGPIFFIQNRVGYNKRVFPLYKFRTMIVNAEKMQEDMEPLNEMDGPVFKIQNDPRITRLGKWLRYTSIDELPQFINVLKGDMSIVGPRPLPVRDFNGFNQDWHRRRFSVLPGITCLWQINGRNTVHFDKWMELDMNYIDNWSLLNDIIILFKTVPVLFKGI